MHEMEGIEVSRGNAHRLDELTLEVREIKNLLKGEQNSPGILERVATMENLMFGKDDKPTDGMVYKVGFMWRAHLWVVSLASAAAALILEHALQLLFKVI